MITKIARYFISNCFAQKHHLPLSSQDPQIHKLIQEAAGIKVIDFTETPTSLAVQQCLGSMMSTKYASGYPGQKNKPGTEIYDQIEKLCWKRALDAFQLHDQGYHVNVQIQSVQSAKLIASKALVKPGGSILALGYLDTECLEKYYEVRKDKNDQENIELIIASDTYGLEDLKTLKNQTSVPILLDISNTSPYFISKIYDQNDLQKFDIIVTGTQSLLGPKGCLLFCKDHFKQSIDEACYPGYQSGPHFHTICGIGAALQETQQKEFAAFFNQVKGNCAALKRQLKIKKFPVLEKSDVNVRIEASSEDYQKLLKSNILAKFRENLIDFNLIPLTYLGIKQDQIPQLSEILALAMYQSIHGQYLQDCNNKLWEQELKNATEKLLNQLE